MIKSTLLIITAVTCATIYASSFCPPEALLTPCTCDNGVITCGGHQPIDIKSVFTSLANGLATNETHFAKLHINNTCVDVLAENTFANVTFDEVSIENATNLTMINVNAFTQTVVLVTTVVSIENNPLLSDGSHHNHSIYDMLRKFVNIEYIYLNYNNISQIPDKAFEPLAGHVSRVAYIQLWGHSYATLGDGAFQCLHALENLDIIDTDISHISSNAFTFTSSSELVFHLTLFGNEQLTSDGFALGSLASIGRPTYLDLNGFLSQQLTYMDEAIFHPFFIAKDDNRMDVRHDPFDCNDCRNRWLARYDYLWPRIYGLQCANGKPFNDSMNFVDCLPNSL